MKHKETIIYLFNNWHNRKHAAIFGEGAFFDLFLTGPQAKQARDLRVGQQCVVASKASDGKVAFDWYSFSHETTLPNDSDPLHPRSRVLFGQHITSDIVPRAEALRLKHYSPLFNKRGDVKQWSTFTVAVSPSELPSGGKSRIIPLAEEVDASAGPYVEGVTKQITVNAYERNAEARMKCIDFHGAQCVVCGFSFAEMYGPLLADYIHVHHLKPLSEITASYQIEPIRDLRPVCPNCHAVIHFGGVLRSIEEVKRLIAVSRRAEAEAHART